MTALLEYLDLLRRNFLCNFLKIIFYYKIKQIGVTVYRETLTKGKFDKSGSNRQIKTNQYKAIAISAFVFYINLLHKHYIDITLLEAL